MKRLLLLWLPLWVALGGPLAAVDYYLAPDGSDSAAGTSPATAWQSLARAEQQSLQPGDAVWLQAGATFAGGFYVPPGRSGNAAAPITLGSYGSGRARIEPGTGREGVMIYNAHHWRIQDLEIVGPGSTATTKTGLSVFCDLGEATRLPGIELRRVTVRGFKAGAGIGGWNGASGFRDIVVEDCVFRDNLLNGFSTYAQQNHGVQNITLRRCTFAANWGDPALTTNSGSGLVLGQVDGARVEYCLAYDNGRNCTAGEGPVGIWAYQSKNLLFQYNRSVRNRRSGTADGGGFDFDGGVTDSVMQYNFSAENDGAGYLLAGYGGSGGVKRVVLRHNLSINDGRRNNYAGILFWGASHADRIRETLVHNNTVVVDATGAYGIPAALRFYGSNVEGVILRNNVFLTRSSAAYLINSGTNLGAAQALLEGNLLACADPAGWRASWAGLRTSGLSWWGAATAQERDGAGNRLASFEDPRLRQPWVLPNLDELTPETALDRAWLAAWLPAIDSPVLDAGVPINAFAGIAPPTHDFAAGSWPCGLPDVGAFEARENLAEWRQRHGLAASDDPLADLDTNGRPDLLDLVMPANPPGAPLKIEFSGSQAQLVWWSPSTALHGPWTVTSSDNLLPPWTPQPGETQTLETQRGWIRQGIDLPQAEGFHRIEFNAD